jgi:hypothetical protein
MTLFMERAGGAGVTEEAGRIPGELVQAINRHDFARLLLRRELLQQWAGKKVVELLLTRELWPLLLGHRILLE